MSVALTLQFNLDYLMCKSIVHCKFTIPNEWVLVNWSLVLSLKMYSKTLI